MIRVLDSGGEFLVSTALAMMIIAWYTLGVYDFLLEL